MSKEAFNDWHTKLPFPTGYEAVGVEAMYICWKAACEYQREKDARLCDAKHANKPWKYAPRDEVAAAIRANKGG